MIPLPLFGQRGSAPPPPNDFTVLLINANQTAGTDITIDDTGQRTITNFAFDGTSAANPPLTGLPSWQGAGAIQKSTNAFLSGDLGALSVTETDYSDKLDITDGEDFMLEFHVRFTTELLTPTQRVLAEITNASNFKPLSIRVTNRLVQFFVNGSLLGDGPQIPLNTWAHIAVTKRGSTWNLYQDGIKTGTRVYNVPAQGDNAFKVRLQSSVEDQPIFDAIRMCKGGAIYYDAFPPPSSEPTAITSDPLIGGRVVFLSNAENGAPGTRPATDDIGNPLNYNATDQASANPNSGHTVENGGKFAQGWFPDSPGGAEFPQFPNSCVYGDGSFKFNSRAALNMCLEGWIKKSSAAGFDYLYIAYNSFGPSTTSIQADFGIGLSESGANSFIQLYKGNASSTNIDVTSTGVNMQNWNHYACVLEGGVGKVYLNGTFVGDWGSSFTSTSSGPTKVVIQSLATTQSRMGTTDAVRLTLGSPVYTGNFSVPTSPPTTTIP